MSRVFGNFVGTMKIVVAPDSFKECLSAPMVAKTIAQAVREMRPDAMAVELPLADGGEGTLDILVQPMKARIEEIQVHDPLGRLITARYGIADETAIRFCQYRDSGEVLIHVIIVA